MRGIVMKLPYENHARVQMMLEDTEMELKSKADAIFDYQNEYNALTTDKMYHNTMSKWYILSELERRNNEK
jgi:hypothetical protein